MKIDDQIRVALREFDNGTIRRGREYYNEGRVLDIVVKSDHYFSSEVEGSFRYSQGVMIGENKTMVGACNCPVGFNCKHVVAAIYKYLHASASLVGGVSASVPANESRQWLDRLIEVNKPQLSISQTLPHGEEFLIYKLFGDEHLDGSQVEFYRARLLKKGGMSKGQYISRNNMLYEFRQKRYVNEIDNKIIAKLNKLEERGVNYTSPILFSGSYGVEVLKELLETKRCFYGNSKEPLVWIDEAKVLEFEWTEDDGSNRLDPNLLDEEFLVVNTTPIICINTQTNSIREIKSPLNTKTISLIFDAPDIPTAEIAQVAIGLTEELPSLPLPKNLEITEIETSMAPQLRLYAERQEGQAIHLAQLSFLYDDYTLLAYPIQDRSYVYDKNRSLKILRQTQDEERCVATLEERGFIYTESKKAHHLSTQTNIQETIERWRLFTTEKLPLLEKEGWQIEIDESFSYHFEYIEDITVESAKSETNNWFELSFSVELGGHTLSLLPIVSSLLEEFESVDTLPDKLNLALQNGNFLHLDTAEIRPILQTLFELFDKKKDDKIILEPHDAHLLEIDEESSIVWKGAKELQALSQKLKTFKGIKTQAPAPSLNAHLRDYQAFGLSWLYFLHEFSFGGILADDMGLGKTIQTLAFLQRLKMDGKLDKPTLIVMPTSLLGNWKNEIARFTPELSLLTLHGMDRAKDFEQIPKHDIILTTYQLAQRDQKRYEDIRFCYLILDEAQKIKNPKTKMAIAIKSLHSEHRLALTGTPIENHLGELWSIFDFVMPGFLENLKTFRGFYQLPIEEEHNLHRKEQLNRKIAPFILRRTKEEVATELPPKTEIIQKAIFGKKQSTLYENIRISMEEKVREVISNKGLSRSHITILDALLKLRQVCCHPQLLKLDAAKQIEESAKLDMFLELIEELQTEGRKVLVFSQFTSMLKILESEVKKRGYTYTKLTGATRKREEAINAFTQGDASIFLISLKAGGVGLNLTQADTVIHYDPWWNPAVENQATDRAYRIGQDKPVFVYKLIIENSIEEKILQLQEKKKSLQDGIYENGGKKEEKAFKADELLSLLQL